MSKVIEWIFNHRWAMTPEALGAIIEIADKRLSFDVDPAIFHKDLADINTYTPDVLTESERLRIKAVEAVDAELLEGTRRTIQRGKVAIIPVRGPIFPRANMFTAWSGGTSVEMLAKDFKVALENYSIKSIVFNVDSPGGEITGISEFADMVFNARGEKRILTYVSGMMASAGYWIGSATSEIISTNTGEIGSIGVVAPFRDTSKADEKRGIQNIEIVSSLSPKKRIDVKTDSGKAVVQEIVDKLAHIFVSAIAKHRGTDVQNVINNFGQGGLVIAKSAIDAGMADRLGSFEQLISEENSKTSSLTIGGFKMNKLIKDATVEDIKAENPDVYKAIVASGKAESEAGIKTAKDEGFSQGVAHENARVQAIESLTSTETADIVNENKFKTDQTKESVALLIVERNKKVADKAKNDIKADGEDAGKKAADIDATSQQGKDEEKKRIASGIAAGMNMARGVKSANK